jgi:hypothetical protein
MSTFTERMIRASRLESALYEEVEADKDALGQAMAVVVLSAVAGGLAVYPTGGMAGIIGGTIGSLIAWYVWAFLTYFIGTRLLPAPATEADFGQLLRTIGFASAPGIIRVVGMIRPLMPVVAVISSLWMLTAMVIAVRQALDYTSTWRALAVCFIGWVVQGLLLLAVLSLFTGFATPTGPQF